MEDTEVKLCKCGCGEFPGYYARTNSSLNQFKGQLREYCIHHKATHITYLKFEGTPSKLCKCGCGTPTRRIMRTIKAKGLIKGEYFDYAPNHSRTPFLDRVGADFSPKICACGCGHQTHRYTRTNPKAGYVKGQYAEFLQGHKRRKHITEDMEMQAPLCACGCGQQVKVVQRLSNGRRRGEYYLYLPYHHLKGIDPARSSQSKETKIKKYAKADREVIFSPYLDNTVVWKSKSAKEKTLRWHVFHEGSKKYHSRVVYEKHHGKIPVGYHIHHISGQATELTDDHPDNLVAIPSIWNWLYMPQLSRGFNISESKVTEVFLSLFKQETYEEHTLFKTVCRELLLKYGGLS